MKKELLTVHGKFQSIMRLTRELDKKPRNFGIGEALSHSEIHLIEIIGDNRDLSVTDIGRHIGITKGAVSQNLKQIGRASCRERV